MKVPDVVSADMHARILIFIRTKGRLAHQGMGYQRMKKECIHSRLEINKNGYRRSSGKILMNSAQDTAKHRMKGRTKIN